MVGANTGPAHLDGGGLLWSPGANMCQAARMGFGESSKRRGKEGEGRRVTNMSREFNWRSNCNIFFFFWVPSVAPHVHSHRAHGEGLVGGGGGGADVNTSAGLTFPFLAALAAQTAACRTKRLIMS